MFEAVAFCRFRHLAHVARLFCQCLYQPTRGDVMPSIRLRGSRSATRRLFMTSSAPDRRNRRSIGNVAGVGSREASTVVTSCRYELRQDFAISRLADAYCPRLLSRPFYAALPVARDSRRSASFRFDAASQAAERPSVPTALNRLSRSRSVARAMPMIKRVEADMLIRAAR